MCCGLDSIRIPPVRNNDITSSQPRFNHHLSGPKGLPGRTHCGLNSACVVAVAPEELSRYATAASRALSNGGITSIHQEGRTAY
eukprot:2400442-Alexandrium_andersonii.AAC.1